MTENIFDRRVDIATSVAEKIHHITTDDEATVYDFLDIRGNRRAALIVLTNFAKITTEPMQPFRILLAVSNIFPLENKRLILQIGEAIFNGIKKANEIGIVVQTFCDEIINRRGEWLNGYESETPLLLSEMMANHIVVRYQDKMQVCIISEMVPKRKSRKPVPASSNSIGDDSLRKLSGGDFPSP